MIHTGQCHCGVTSFSFQTRRELSPRACQCSFCRKHNARSVSDPEGSAVLRLGPETLHYRFGTGTTDFVICGRCGIYVGAVTEIDGAAYATLNLNAFDDPRLDLASEPASYEGEEAAAKAARRRRNWTPARLD
jgi:hypothetical protein